MKKTRVSVCIATYNQAGYLRQCVESVLQQVEDADVELEILVGNDGSTDASEEVLADLAKLFPGVVLANNRSPNVGAARNYQLLIAQATGDFIAHLDGDDYWLPGKLKCQLDFLKAHSSCVSVCTNALVVDEANNKKGIFTGVHPSEIDTNHLIARGNFLNHSSLLYRAAGAAPLIRMKYPFVDYKIHLELSKLGNIGCINTPYVVYRCATQTSMQRVMPTHVKDMLFEALAFGLPMVSRSIQMEAIATYAVLNSRPLLPLTRHSNTWFRCRKLLELTDHSPVKLLFKICGRGVAMVVNQLRIRFVHWIDPQRNPATLHPRI